MTILIRDIRARQHFQEESLWEIELLLHQETEYLDLGDYDSWLKLFTRDCIYWVPSEPGQLDPENHISLFYEDRMLMEVRIAKLQHPQSHPMHYPLRCSHVVSNQIIEKLDETTGAVTVSSRFLMTEYYRHEQRAFSGSYEYCLSRLNNDYRIKMKRVNLINCDAILEPIQMYI